MSGFQSGKAGSRAEQERFADVLEPAEFDGVFEAVFLLKQTGIALAGWTRSAVPREVVSVMAATMWGSIDTMVRTLGGEAPRSAYLETEDRRVLAMQVDPNWTLLLIAPRSTGRRRLRNEAQRIVERIARLRRESGPRGIMATVRD